MARKETAEELRKSSIVPLYHQIATAIEKAIQKRIYPEGSMIPSEKELGETYQVSRVTVRQAMQRLLDNNLIVRKPGLGTFVRRKVITQTMDELLGFYPSLLKRGLKPRIQILEYQVVSPKPEVEKNLRLPPGEKDFAICPAIFFRQKCPRHDSNEYSVFSSPALDAEGSSGEELFLPVAGACRGSNPELGAENQGFPGFPGNRWDAEDSQRKPDFGIEAVNLFCGRETGRICRPLLPGGFI